VNFEFKLNTKAPEVKCKSLKENGSHFEYEMLEKFRVVRRGFDFEEGALATRFECEQGSLSFKQLHHWIACRDGKRVELQISRKCNGPRQ
jgi:hypothetical protein